MTIRDVEVRDDNKRARLKNDTHGKVRCEEIASKKREKTTMMREPAQEWARCARELSISERWKRAARHDRCEVTSSAQRERAKEDEEQETRGGDDNNEQGTGTEAGKARAVDEEVVEA